jgi:hypothetical protein
VRRSNTVIWGCDSVSIVKQDGVKQEGVKQGGKQGGGESNGPNMLKYKRNMILKLREGEARRSIV